MVLASVVFLVVGGLCGLGCGYYLFRRRPMPDGGRETADREPVDEKRSVSVWEDGTEEGPLVKPREPDEIETVYPETNIDEELEDDAVAAVWDHEDDIDRRYRTLMENYPRGILSLFDEDGQYIVTGGQLYKYIGLSPDDFVGRTMQECFNDEYVDEWGDSYDAVFEGEETTFEFRHGDRYFRKHLVPVWDDDGETVDVGMGITKDITELRRRERALRASEQRYRTLAENFPDGALTLFDEAGHFYLVGGRLFDNIQQDPDDFVGYTIEEAFQSTYVDRYGDSYDAVFEGEDTTFEFRHGDRYFRKHLVPVWDDEESTVEVGMEITYDITELREREQALEESQQRYKTLVENFPRGVVALFDDGLQYEFVRGGAFDYLDLAPEDFEGHTIEAAHTEGYVDRYREQFEDCLGGTASSFTFTHDDRIYRTELVPVRDEDGRVTQGMSISTDVTDLKRRERELGRQNERLEEFVGMVSHDLRNPIQVLRGRLQLLEAEVDSEHLDRSQDAADRMEELIEDMLTLARQGESVTDPDPVPLVQAAHDAWGTADTRDATLNIEIDGTAIPAEANRLRQLLENCYRNAVDHGPDDVTVTVGALDDESGFYVADDGPGIPPDEREQVLEHGYSTASGGTGFGLAIVSEIVEAHGWDVTVTASEDGGARFEFRTG